MRRRRDTSGKGYTWVTLGLSVMEFLDKLHYVQRTGSFDVIELLLTFHCFF